MAGSVRAEYVMAYQRAHGPRAVGARAKDSLETLAMAGAAVHARVRSHMDMLVSKIGDDGARERVEALLKAAWE